MNQINKKTIHELKLGEIIHTNPISKSSSISNKSSTSSAISNSTKFVQPAVILEIPLKTPKKVIQSQAETINSIDNLEKLVASPPKTVVREQKSQQSSSKSRYSSESNIQTPAIHKLGAENNIPKMDKAIDSQPDMDAAIVPNPEKIESLRINETQFHRNNSDNQSEAISKEISTNQQFKSPQVVESDFGNLQRIQNENNLSDVNAIADSAKDIGLNVNNSGNSFQHATDLQSQIPTKNADFDGNLARNSATMQIPVSGSIPPPPKPNGEHQKQGFNPEALAPLDSLTPVTGQMTTPENFNLAPSSAPIITDMLGSLSNQSASSNDEVIVGAASEPKIKRSFIIYSFLTATLIISTIGLIIFLAWPRLQGLFQSQTSNHSQQFNDVLVNLLQVDNHDLQVDLRQENIQSIIPSSNSSSNLVKASATIDNQLKIQYPRPGGLSYIETQFKFDIISIQNDGQRSNLIINVSTVYQPDGKAYFKLNSLVIDKKRLELDPDFAQRWSDLEALFKLNQTGLDQSSQILNHVINFLRYYSAHQYIILLPSFNIAASQDYKLLQNAMQNTSAYTLDEDSCQFVTTAEVRCNLTINYQKLYEFYSQIYDEILDQALPSYYQRLTQIQSGEFYLPNNFQITFDRHTKLPITLVHISENDQNFHLQLDYDNYDDQTFDQKHISDSLDIREYYRKVLDYELEIFNRN